MPILETAKLREYRRAITKTWAACPSCPRPFSSHGAAEIDECIGKVAYLTATEIKRRIEANADRIAANAAQKSEAA